MRIASWWRLSSPQCSRSLLPIEPEPHAEVVPGLSDLPGSTAASAPLASPSFVLSPSEIERELYTPGDLVLAPEPGLPTFRFGLSFLPLWEGV